MAPGAAGRAAGHGAAPRARHRPGAAATWAAAADHRRSSAPGLPGGRPAAPLRAPGTRRCSLARSGCGRRHLYWT